MTAERFGREGRCERGPEEFSEGQGERNSVEAQLKTLELVRDLLKRAGVDFSSNAMPIGPTGLPQATGKAIYYNEWRATWLLGDRWARCSSAPPFH
jgi:hypothetical protein